MILWQITPAFPQVFTEFRAPLPPPWLAQATIIFHLGYWNTLTGLLASTLALLSLNPLPPITLFPKTMSVPQIASIRSHPITDLLQWLLYTLITQSSSHGLPGILGPEYFSEYIFYHCPTFSLFSSNIPQICILSTYQLCTHCPICQQCFYSIKSHPSQFHIKCHLLRETIIENPI